MNINDQLLRFMQMNKDKISESRTVSTSKSKEQVTQESKHNGTDYPSNNNMQQTQSLPVPFTMSFGVTVKFYPNGEAWISKTFPLGKPRNIVKKQDKKLKNKKELKPTVIEDEEVY